MKKILVLLAGLPLAALVPGAATASATTAPAVRRLTVAPATGADVYYAGTKNPQQTLAYYPSAGTKRPWVMTIHGGSWMYADKSHISMYYARSYVFSRVGVTVFNIDYRLGSDTVKYKDQIWDLTTALNFIRANAAVLRVDPNRGMIYGYSAGGHLATELGLTGDGTGGIKGIVTISGILQPYRVVYPGVTPTDGNLTLMSLAAADVGCTYDVCPAKWTDFDPQNKLSAHDPALLSFAGGDDTLVPPQTMLDFKALAAAKKVPMTAVVVAHYGHTDYQVWHEPANIKLMQAFARSRLGCRSTRC